MAKKGGNENIPVRNRKTRVRIGEISRAVLGIVAVSGAVALVAVAPGVTYALAPFLKKKKYEPKQAVQRSVDTLIKNGLLKRTTKNGKLHLVLTKKGKWEAGIRGLGKDIEKERMWDRRWRVVVFDVAEHNRKLRDELRRAMQLYGFMRLQQSVWVYPYPCEDFIKLIKEYLGIAHDVLYLKAESIENEKHLITEFSLK